VVGSFGRVTLLTAEGGTIQNADGFSSQFDHELLNHMFNGFALVDRHRDGAVVLTSAELALNEDVSAFDQTAGYWFKAFAMADNVVPLRLPFHSFFSRFQDFFVAIENFTTGVPMGKNLVLAWLPTKPMIES
jgi:hypothetical protein